MAKPWYLNEKGRVFLSQDDWAKIKGNGTKENPYTINGEKISGTMDIAGKGKRNWVNLVNGVIVETKNDLGATVDSGNLNPFEDNPLDGTKVSTDTPMTTWIVNLLKNEPQLKAIYDTVRDPITGKFLYSVDAIVDMITSSDWYLSKGPTVAGNIAARYKFGEKWYQQNLNQFKITVSGIATGIGLDATDPTISEYLTSLAEASFLNGWDTAYIENTIIGNADIISKAGGGLFQSQVQDLTSYAKLMGVDLSKTTMTDYQRRLMGSVTPEGFRVRATPDQIKKEIADQQALLYPFFSDDFAAGKTLWDVTSLHRRKWADLLEIDEDALDWNDPLWKDGKIFSYTDEKTGKVVMRPAWDAEKLIRQDERWQYTENATRLYEGLGTRLLTKFGLAAI